MEFFQQQSPLPAVLSPLLAMDADSFYSSPDDSNDSGFTGLCSPTGPTAQQTSSSSLKRARSSVSSSSKDGAVLTRAPKRRKSRAKPKPPVRELSANKLNFKDMVHQYTGAPSYNPPFHNTVAPFSSQVLPSAATVYNGTDWAVPQHMIPSALSNGAPVTEKDALLAGALLAESLKTLDTISSYLLHPSLPSCTAQEGSSITQLSDAGDQLITESKQPLPVNVREIEDVLLKGDGKLDNFFSLSCVLLNQIATQWGALSQSYVN